MADESGGTLPHTPSHPAGSGTLRGAQPIHVGQVIGRKYRIVRRLGQGAMGVVFEATDTVLERPVALKFLPDEVAADTRACEAFLQEARTAARLNHPNVVTIHEADRDGAICFLAMERIDGGTAQDALRNGPLNWRAATRLVADVARGLAAAHAAGLIHRDIKPANIMLTSAGAAKLADFGLALVAPGANQSLTGEGRVAGTPNYMSPEQCRGERVGPRSDIYALGATYYHLLTGRHPFPRDSVPAVLYAHCHEPVPAPHVAVPEACLNIVRRAMAKDAADRPRTATEMLAALDAILADAQEDVARVSPPMLGETSTGYDETQSKLQTQTLHDQAPSFSGSRRKWLIAAGGGVLAVGAGLAMFLGGTEGPAPSGTAVPAKKRESVKALGEPTHVVDTEGHVKSLAFSPRDPDLFGWGTADGFAIVRTVAGVERGRYSKPGIAMRQIAFSNTEDYWGVEYNDGLRFFDFMSKQPVSRLETKAAPGDSGNITSMCWHPAGSQVVLGVTDNRGTTGRIAIWPGDQPRDYRYIGEDHTPVYTVAASRDGKRLVSGHSNGTVIVWEFSSGNKQKEMEIGNGPVRRVAFLDEGIIAVTDNKIELRDPDTGKQRAVLVESRGAILSFAVAPGISSQLAWAIGDEVFVYDVKSAQQVFTLKIGDGPVRIIALSQEGRWLACGGRERGLGLWDLRR